MSLVTDLLVAFAAPARRHQAVERLAALINCERVVLLAPAGSEGELRTIVPVDSDGAGVELETAPTVRGADGSVLVAIGGTPRAGRLAWAGRLLPAITALVSAGGGHGSNGHGAAGALDEAARAKHEFLATLSHELRTPLNAMLGWVQMLRLYGHDPSVWGRAVDAIDRNAHAQAQLVSNLLDVSRLVTGSVQIRRGPVDLPGIVHSVCDLLRPVMAARRQVLTLETADLPGTVVGDADRLQQAVWNLVANATKFTPRGGRIQVRLDAAAHVARLTVADSGIGIPPEFVPHVFECFRQYDGTITRAYGGLGLGLAIVRHIVELHGGSVEAASRGRDHGATFTVRVPLQQPIS